MLINGRKKVGIKKFKNPKIFTNYSQAINNVYESLEDCNSPKKRKGFQKQKCFPRKKNLLEKVSTIKWFEYLLLGKGLKP